MRKATHPKKVRFGEHMKGERGVRALVVNELRPGDRVVVKTSNSMYEFWVEFPELAIGVIRGGTVRTPTRVRLSAENAGSLDASVEPLRVGEKARVVLLGPFGVAVRGFVTSTIASIAVDGRDRLVA